MPFPGRLALTASLVAAGALLALLGGCGSDTSTARAQRPPQPDCERGAKKVRSAAALRRAVASGRDACVVARIADAELRDLGRVSGVVLATEGGSIGHLDLFETTGLTIRNARLRSLELWYADGTTIADSVIGGSAANRTYDNLVNVNVSPDVTIKGNEIAWTLAGSNQTAGYGIRSPGNSLGHNSRLRIENNYIHHIAADGIQGLGANAQNVVIDRNRIDYVGQEPGSNEHADAIQVIDHGPNLRITNNWISHEGYFAAGQSSGGSGTLYVHGGSSNSLRIENNLFSDSLGRVLFGGGLSPSDAISNLTFRRNTVLNVGRSYKGFPGLHWDVDAGSNNVIERNVAEDDDGGFADLGAPGTVRLRGNLWRRSGSRGALRFSPIGECLSPACRPEGPDPVGYRVPSGVSW